jgi:hypothetical protein
VRRQHEGRDNEVDAVDEQRHAVKRIMPEERGRYRHERDRQQVQDVEPQDPPVHAGTEVILIVVPHPHTSRLMNVTMYTITWGAILRSAAINRSAGTVAAVGTVMFKTRIVIAMANTPSESASIRVVLRSSSGSLVNGFLKGSTTASSWYPPRSATIADVAAVVTWGFDLERCAGG